MNCFGAATRHQISRTSEVRRTDHQEKRASLYPREVGRMPANFLDRDGWDQLIAANCGDEILAFAARIFPICRSITGDGVRGTLREIGSHLALETREIPTGTEVFDWTVPREWNIRDAYVKNSAGEKIVDFGKSNLHVMSYSVPVRKLVSLDELRDHVHTLPKQPDLIPYRTSYYADAWGFCMAHRQLENLQEDTYEVMIDSSLENGSLTYGEYLHKGETDEEFLLSAHVCHPSLANDNCSGIALLTHLARKMVGFPTRLSYRFLFAPGTIGAIAWLASNEGRTQRVKHGLVVSMVGDGGGPTYKRSRQGDAAIDRAMGHVLSRSGLTPTIEDFSPYGYDERQYCSPGFNLPVGLFQRSKYGTIPQYHTSADNLTFLSPQHLLDSYRLIVKAIGVIESNAVYRNTRPRCEPQLGKRGLYGSVGGNDLAAENIAMLWVLNLSDGTYSLLDIAERSKLPFEIVLRAARQLEEHGLLAEDRRFLGPA
jgi:aminopeptidase-like protein